MQATTQIVVKDKTYTIRMFSPTRATKLFAKLVKLAGPALATMADFDPKKGNEVELLSKALMVLAQNLDENQFDVLLKELLNGAVFENQTVDVMFDTHFVGGISSAFLVAAEVIKHNYKDFLHVLPGGKNLLVVAKV